MTSESPITLRPEWPPSEPLVRTFMLARYAEVRQDLLNIIGGGINWVYMDATQDPPMAPLTLVIGLSLPPNMTDQEHSIRVRVVDLDGQPVGPADGYFVAGSASVTALRDGRPEEDYPLRVTIGPFVLPAREPGTVLIRLEFGDRIIATMPLTLFAPGTVPPRR